MPRFNLEVESEITKMTRTELVTRYQKLSLKLTFTESVQAQDCLDLQHCSRQLAEIKKALPPTIGRQPAKGQRKQRRARNLTQSNLTISGKIEGILKSIIPPEHNTAATNGSTGTVSTEPMPLHSDSDNPNTNGDAGDVDMVDADVASPASRTSKSARTDNVASSIVLNSAGIPPTEDIHKWLFTGDVELDSPIGSQTWARPKRLALARSEYMEVLNAKLNMDDSQDATWPRVLLTNHINRSMDDISSELRHFATEQNRQVIDRMGSWRSTILHLAARSGQEELLKGLLQCAPSLGLDYVNVRDLDGATPLCVAIAIGSVAAAQLLLEYGADITATSHGGMTVLHSAVRFGHTDSVQLLLECGADPTAVEDIGQIPYEMLFRCRVPREEARRMLQILWDKMSAESRAKLHNRRRH
ncbi:hypothetical protein MMC18_007867 [Xylographa bjoerkii]|nr:hypothetical protein [Xylographa bjoerkii]